MTRRWGFLHLAVLRPLLTVTVLVCLYYLLPVDQVLRPWTVAVFAGGLAVVVLLVVGEVRMILRSPFPAWQGVQALALILPLFLLLFADVYYVLGHSRPGAFGSALSRTDALYFTVTVFATVGFGDITPVSAAARVLVTLQMVADLIVLSVVLRVIVTAVQQRRSSTKDEPRGAVRLHRPPSPRPTRKPGYHRATSSRPDEAAPAHGDNGDHDRTQRLVEEI